jgi:hypothetical protein
MITSEQCRQCRWPSGLLDRVAQHNNDAEPSDSLFVSVTCRHGEGGGLFPVPDGSLYVSGDGTVVESDETCPNGHRVWVFRLVTA